LRTHTRHTLTFNARAFFLALLIFTAFGGKELHIALEHSHAAVDICDAKAGDVHLHDYENLAHGCDLCDFTFSFFNLQLSSFYLNLPVFLPVKKEFIFIPFNFSASYLLIRLRGPPVFDAVVKTLI
jgi:hypothetical protein